MNAPDARWWEAAFGPAYLDAYLHRDATQAREEAAAAVALLGLGGGARVLDAACGAGRHLLALSDAGFAVAGVDRSEALLAAAHRARGGLRLVRGDLRALPFRSGAFAAVVSFFTSFGYFDDAGDRDQIAEVRRVLRTGGRHLLDFLNAPRVVSSLVPEGVREAGAARIRERRRIRGGRVEKSVEVERDGSVLARWTESVRLWSRAEVEEILRGAGLRVVRVAGDLGGAPWSAGSPRLVVVSEAA